MKKVFFLSLFLSGTLLLNAQEAIKPDTIKPDNVFRSVEQMPEFPGGKTAMMKYLRDNIRYPELQDGENIVGSLLAEFIVKSDGNICCVEIKRPEQQSSFGKIFSDIIYNMPRWTPGKQNGKQVDVYYMLPISCIKWNE